MTNIPLPFLQGKSLDQRTIARTLNSTLARWCSLIHSNHFFIKLVSTTDSNTINFTAVCMLKLAWQTKSLLSAQLAFFGASFELRNSVTSDLQLLISKTFITLSTSNSISTEVPRIYPFSILEQNLTAILLRPSISVDSEIHYNSESSILAQHPDSK